MKAMDSSIFSQNFDSTFLEGIQINNFLLVSFVEKSANKN